MLDEGKYWEHSSKVVIPNSLKQINLFFTFHREDLSTSKYETQRNTK